MMFVSFTNALSSGIKAEVIIAKYEAVDGDIKTGVKQGRIWALLLCVLIA